MMADHHLWFAHRMSHEVYSSRSAGIKKPKIVPISNISHIEMITVASIVGHRPQLLMLS